MILLFTALSKVAIDYFMTGATAAISLYCGVKIPKNKRGKS